MSRCWLRRRGCAGGRRNDETTNRSDACSTERDRAVFTSGVGGKLPVLRGANPARSRHWQHGRGRYRRTDDARTGKHQGIALLPRTQLRECGEDYRVPQRHEQFRGDERCLRQVFLARLSRAFNGGGGAVAEGCAGGDRSGRRARLADEPDAKAFDHAVLEVRLAFVARGSKARVHGAKPAELDPLKRAMWWGLLVFHSRSAIWIASGVHTLDSRRIRRILRLSCLENERPVRTLTNGPHR